MAIKSIKEELCTGCGICVEHCQMDVFRLDEKVRKAHIVYPEDCVVCYVCEFDCPENAVVLTPEAVARLWFSF